MTKLKKEKDPKILKLLKNVMDPELQIPIVEMGLIYEAKLKENTAFIVMTLTTVGCPLFNIIESDIKEALLASDDIEKVEIELTFDPPWHPGMMSERYRLEFGL